jgi:uncharacterized protein YbjT (DUF2867 family)
VILNPICANTTGQSQLHRVSIRKWQRLKKTNETKGINNMSTLTSNTTPTILAVGAAGHFASLVVPELAKRGAKVRGLIRHPEQSHQAIENGAAEVAIGDLTDRASLDAALKDVDSVFYISPAAMPNEVEVSKSFVDAAKQASVRRFVFSSLIHPIIGAMAHHIAKAPIEEAILASDMECTLLHPAMFFQNFTAAELADVAKRGVFGQPWSADSYFSRVDYRDVAEVAAIALMEDRLNYGTFELCAEGHLTGKDVAALMGEVLGQKIEAVAIHPSQPSPMQPMFDWYDRHGLVGNSLILRAILGREPRSLRAYLEELAAKL